MKLAIVGSRNFVDYKHLCENIDSRNLNLIISGGAPGADSLAKRYAEDRKIPLQVFNADWKKFGKSAGFLRNTQIVDACDGLIAFWDGSSPGTRDTISKIKISKKPYKVVKI